MPSLARTSSPRLPAMVNRRRPRRDPAVLVLERRRESPDAGPVGGALLRTSGRRAPPRSPSRQGPGAAVAYLGDDRTDEDAFAALQGLGLAVLVRTSPRPTAANLWIEPTEELVEFLARWRLAQASRH